MSNLNHGLSNVKERVFADAPGDEGVHDGVRIDDTRCGEFLIGFIGL